MKIYRYWAQASFRSVDSQGFPLATTAYAGSDTSLQDAQAQANAELQRRVSWLQADEPEAARNPFHDYPPPTRPIREEVLWRQDSPDGQPLAAMTRSRNGYLVLNTTHLMMVDVDHLPRQNTGIKGLLSFFSRTKTPPATEAEVLQTTLETWLARHPGWGLRVYRTKAGYRYLITHAPLDARDPVNIKVMKDLHADDMYVMLCRRQECYRARLTPKAHRVRWQRPEQTFPYQNDQEIAAQRDWEDSYAAIIERYGTVELLGQYGQAGIHPELKPLIDLHDQYALKPGFPLA